jgi:hypothetical protein
MMTELSKDDLTCIKSLEFPPPLAVAAACHRRNGAAIVRKRELFDLSQIPQAVLVRNFQHEREAFD